MRPPKPVPPSRKRDRAARRCDQCKADPKHRRHGATARRLPLAERDRYAATSERIATRSSLGPVHGSRRTPALLIGSQLRDALPAAGLTGRTAFKPPGYCWRCRPGARAAALPPSAGLTVMTVSNTIRDRVGNYCRAGRFKQRLKGVRCCAPRHLPAHPAAARGLQHRNFDPATGCPATSSTPRRSWGDQSRVPRGSPASPGVHLAWSTSLAPGSDVQRMPPRATRCRRAGAQGEAEGAPQGPAQAGPGFGAGAVDADRRHGAPLDRAAPAATAAVGSAVARSARDAARSGWGWGAVAGPTGSALIHCALCKRAA
jgi:hypothetical protein